MKKKNIIWLINIKISPLQNARQMTRMTCFWQTQAFLGPSFAQVAGRRPSCSWRWECAWLQTATWAAWSDPSQCEMHTLSAQRSPLQTTHPLTVTGERGVLHRCSLRHPAFACGFYPHVCLLVTFWFQQYYTKKTMLKAKSCVWASRF